MLRFTKANFANTYAELKINMITKESSVWDVSSFYCLIH